MTDTQEYPWIKHYPEGVPATINPEIYESLPDFQEKICQEYGDAPVFTSLGKTMTYKEFDEKVTAFASYLQSLPGVEQGDRDARHEQHHDHAEDGARRTLGAAQRQDAARER